MQSAMQAAARGEYRWLVDREAIAREQRRRQVLQALEFERDREAALVDQLHEIVAEAEGAHVDEAAFAKMDPDEVQLVRDVLGAPADVAEDDEVFAFDDWDAGDDTESDEDEVARLEQEIEQGRSRQRAYTRYLDALGE